MKAALFIFLTCSVAGFAQNTKDWRRYDEMLRQRKFEEVYSECKANLKEPYGKTSYLNHYYIGQSLCGAGYTQQGIGWYRYIREKFPIDKNFGDRLAQAISKCNVQPITPAGTTVTVIINNSITPSGVTGGVRGKSGFQMSCDKDNNENYDKLRANDSLSSRVFQVTQKEEALINLRKFLPDNQYNIDTSGRFMLVYELSQGHSTVMEAAYNLEIAYQYFIGKYKLGKIDKLFTVYLVNDKSSLQHLAKLVHDISISKGNIGYSSLNDLSLLGIAKGQTGTLIHELFHLMIRSDLGDVSPWLDEGVACMYSVYHKENERLEGSYDTWRVTHFKMLINLKSLGKVHVPSLSQLLNYNWDEYQGGIYNSFCDASVNYALSNFFALYLQFKELDATTIKTFKNRQYLSSDTLSPGPSDIELLEKVFSKGIDVISAEFYNWLSDRYNINMKELLLARRAYMRSDLPARFQMFLDSADAELDQLKKNRKSVRKRELKSLEEEKAILFESIALAQRDLAWEQEQVIGLLSKSSGLEGDGLDRIASMYKRDSDLLKSSEVNFEKFLAKKESEANAFIVKLRSKF